MIMTKAEKRVRRRFVNIVGCFLGEAWIASAAFESWAEFRRRAANRNQEGWTVDVPAPMPRTEPRTLALSSMELHWTRFEGAVLSAEELAVAFQVAASTLGED